MHTIVGWRKLIQPTALGYGRKTIVGFLDYANFDRASHRDSSAEAATSIGRTLVNYGVLHNFLVWNGINDHPYYWPFDYPFDWY